MLRQNGVRVSTAEVLDAVRAVQVGMDDRPAIQVRACAPRW